MSSGESELDDDWFMVNPKGEVINLVKGESVPDETMSQNERIQTDVKDETAPDSLSPSTTIQDDFPLPPSWEVDTKEQSDEVAGEKTKDNFPIPPSWKADTKEQPDEVAGEKTNVGTSSSQVESSMEQCEADSSVLKANETPKQRRNSSSSDISLIDEQNDVARMPTLPDNSQNFVCLPPSLVLDTEDEQPLNLVKMSCKNTASQTVRRRRRAAHHKIGLLGFPDNYVVSILLIMFLFILTSTYNNNSKKLLLSFSENLESIEKNILACLGEQHLDIIQGNASHRRTYLVCEGKNSNYRQKIEEKFACPEIQPFLAAVQRLLLENKSADIPTLTAANISQLNLLLMVVQMEYYELLPAVLKNPVFLDNPVFGPTEVKIVLSQFEEIAKNLTLLNEQMRTVVGELSIDESCQVKYFIHGGNEKGYVRTELEALLDDKMHDLYTQYESIASAVENLKKEDPLLNKQEEIAPDRDESNSRSSLPIQAQIDMLKDMQEKTFEEVKNLYELLIGVGTMDDDAESTDYNDPDFWSLGMLKKNMKDYIQNAHNSIKERVEDYREDVTETLSSLVQDGKKHAEDTLNIVTDYFKEAKQGTHNILKGNLPNSFINSIRNVWEGLKYKMPHDKRDTDNTKFHDSADANMQENSCPHANKENVEPTADLPIKNVNFDVESDSWFFERAAVREKRRDSAKGAINWYLAREKLRERQRKLQKGKTFTF